MGPRGSQDLRSPSRLWLLVQPIWSSCICARAPTLKVFLPCELSIVTSSFRFPIILTCVHSFKILLGFLWNGIFLFILLNAVFLRTRVRKVESFVFRCPVMPTFDCVSGFHNRLEFIQSLSCLVEAMQPCYLSPQNF